MIIPHIIDQYAWNDIVSSIGVGPSGIAVNKITNKNLEQKILDLFQNRTYKTEAYRVSKKIKSENLKESLYKAIIE